jgi:transposase
MIGKKQQTEPKLFYHGVSLDRRVGPEHPLRKIKNTIDFDFVRKQVAQLYGTTGNPSVDPVVILKLIFLLFYENIKSERALMAQLPLRLDWLWFCGYDLDDSTPNHSVLSKARRRWGTDVFKQFFQNILEQCIEAGLVDGQTIHLDSSMIDADASKDKLQVQLRVVAGDLYEQLEENSEDQEIGKKVSPVDPDARLGKKYSQTTLGYKDHRTVDDKHGIITSTTTTPANVCDNHVLSTAIEAHESNTGQNVKTAAADKIYGTLDNYEYLHNKGCKACIAHQKHGVKADDKFSHEHFIYDKQQDCFICPAGERLELYDHQGPRDGTNNWRYRASRKTCEACEYFSKCVSSKTHGRQVVRNVRAGYLQWADECLTAGERKRLMSRRQAKAEGSFADAANNHGFKRARWRGLTMVEIQNLIIAAIQNLRKLVKVTAPRKPAGIGVLATLESKMPILGCILQRMLSKFGYLSKISVIKEF